MVTTVESARDMIRGMNPVLQPGRFVFWSSADGEPPASFATPRLQHSARRKDCLFSCRRTTR